MTDVESQDEKRNNPGYFEEFFWNLLARTEKATNISEYQSGERLEQVIFCI
jgi:hypothetical protein